MQSIATLVISVSDCLASLLTLPAACCVGRTSPDGERRVDSAGADVITARNVELDTTRHRASANSGEHDKVQLFIQRRTTTTWLSLILRLLVRDQGIVFQLSTQFAKWVQTNLCVSTGFQH